jgi:hypothetical protein
LAAGFDELMGRVAFRFSRVEPRRRAGAFVLGLLAGLPRVNCWTIAEHAGESTPDGMQHLLARISAGSSDLPRGASGQRWHADGSSVEVASRVQRRSP